VNKDKKRHIAILGSTGSIGTQALDVIEANPDLFTVEVITANRNADLLIQQAIKFKPNTVVITEEQLYDKVFDALDSYDIKVYAGASALASVVTMDSIDVVLTALVGYAGLKPTIEAIKAKKTIALANKETLVVAGELITNLAFENGVNILPVDSEHSAIFQCLVGEFHNKIEKVILTASGGPFRGRKTADLQNVTIDEALNHPNWSMGSKITIDSASLMNKGLEVIEAKWLFAIEPNQIDVVVHPQSIIHSMVQFEDGSIKSQMGLPDMKLPIQYALAYPNRIYANFERLDFTKFSKLTFEEPDIKTFRNLQLAYDVLDQGGNAACALNAANEITVEAFLNNKIGFLDIARLNEEAVNRNSFVQSPSYEDLVATDRETRIKIIEKIA
jgi:1-deoxy-D-xylulose-5-phosphate reductoisomerase